MIKNFKFIIVLYTLFVIGFSKTIIAQSDGKLKLGLHINTGLAWMSPENNGWENNGLRGNVSYGLIANIKIYNSDNYFFHTGIFINHLNGKLRYNDVYIGDSLFHRAVTEANYRMRYVEIPMAIKLKTNEIGYNTFYGVFGAQFGINVRTKADFNTNYDASGNTPAGNKSIKNEDIQGQFLPIRADLVLGAGVERNISGNTFYFIGLTYNNGLTNLLKGNAYALDGNGKTEISTNGLPIEDKKLNTRLHYISLNFGIMF